MPGEFKKPKISVGGVFVDSTSISWPMLAGVKSGNMQLNVTKATAEEIMALSNPVELKFIVDVWDGISENGVETKTVTKVIKNLYILEVQAADDPWWFHIKIGDQRIFWENLVFSREYNVHKSSGILERAIFGSGRASASNQSIFEKQKYAPWSLKNTFNYKFANSADLRNGIGEPWTAYGVMTNIIEQEFGLTVGTGAGHYRSEGFNNDYQVEGLSWELSSVTTALSQVLSMARMNIYQHPDGEIVIYDTRDESSLEKLFKNFQPMEGSGWPVVQDLSKVRPGNIRAIFSPVEHELRFDFAEGVTNKATKHFGSKITKSTTVPFTLKNVIQIPDDLTLSIDGGDKRKYIRGTWLPIKDVVKAWGALDGPGKRRKKTLDIESIIKYWFTDKLEYIWSIDFALPDQVDPVWSRRINAIRDNYRTTFMIDPIWMNRIKSWKANRVAVLDPISGLRQPSPVFVNYCEIPSFRLAASKKNRKKHKAAYNVVGWDYFIDKMNPSPFSIRILDQQAGIFKIQHTQDIQQLVSSVIPSEVYKIPFLSAGSNPKDLLWNGARLVREHHLSVIISAVLAEPNDEKRHHIIYYKLSNSNKSKAFDLPIKSMGARYKWTDKTIGVMDKDQVIIRNAELVNEDALKSIGDAEVQRLQESWRDLIIGQFSQLGYKDEWVPMASMRSVTIKFSKNRGLETSFNMTERPPKIDVYELLPQSVRKVIYKQLSQ